MPCTMVFQRSFLRYLFMIYVLVLFDVSLSHAEQTSTENKSVIQTTESSQTNGTIYAWSSWGNWSKCSKSCGGGVAVQERQCLPKSPSRWQRRRRRRRKLESSDKVRHTRQVPSTVPNCPGLARRYHECNTAPCPGGSRDSRADQCAVYDRRPFRGRFYTWVPYIDGNSPCTLNCRPRGEQFYASLALVSDGTPCTKPNFRAICVQGNCMVVGREAVLASQSSQELHCGRRLVSGLFSRPRLPLGYSYVTTVPRGACRLNVSEIMPSDNYIALKISNGSFIVNGEFAISAPGIYEAAGARFTYSRQASLDSISAIGPIQYPIDIMILYTKPTPAIKYEYFTDSLPGEVEEQTRANIPEIFSTSQPRHIRRHHGNEPFSRPFSAPKPKYPDFVGLSKEVGDDPIEKNIIGGRRFLWKIKSYTQCSRSCGGGIQLGKYRCVEENSNSDREVSPVHCLGSAPAARRRRCGTLMCSPRWRTAAWTSCPKCGPATRTRIVGCVQDHSRGITKVSDQKCPAPKPPTTDICNIPNCEDQEVEETGVIETKRVLAQPREQVDQFRDGPVYSVSVDNFDVDVGPEYSFSAAAGWLYTEWSECKGWCVGGGVQTRGLRCADPSGCAPRKSPETSKTCSPQLVCNPHEGTWFTGEWSACTSSCGGKQIRGVLCIGGTGRHLKDNACKGQRPDHEKSCGESCKPTWFLSDWTQCKGNCSSGTGVQTRTVWCAEKDDASDETKCDGAKPDSKRPCSLQCPGVTIATIPPDMTIESQIVSGFETTTHTPRTTTILSETKDCEDIMSNCALAVQARLCHYKYYERNCCQSCKGR